MLVIVVVAVVVVMVMVTVIVIVIVHCHVYGHIASRFTIPSSTPAPPSPPGRRRSGRHLLQPHAAAAAHR